MIKNLNTRYWPEKGTTTISYLRYEWGQTMHKGQYIYHTLKLVQVAIAAPNRRILWKYGLDYIAYKKGYWRWRRSIQDYYWANKN